MISVIGQSFPPYGTCFCILMLPLSPSSRVTLRMSQKKIDVNLSTSLPWDFSRFICSDYWGGKKPLGLSHFCVLFNFFFLRVRHFLWSKTYFEESHGNKIRSTCLVLCLLGHVKKSGYIGYFFYWNCMVDFFIYMVRKILGYSCFL